MLGRPAAPAASGLATVERSAEALAGTPPPSKPTMDTPMIIDTGASLPLMSSSPLSPAGEALTIAVPPPIAPLPARSRRTSTQPSSPITPRTSARARKPSAKVAEMAEAGPSGTSGSAAVAAEQAVLEELPAGPAFLQPDHFSPLNNGAKPPTYGRSRWESLEAQEFLSPEDDPMALRGIPVFRPTMEEFQDFEGYVNQTAPWGMRSGITKIIPPPEWTDTLPPMSAQALSKVHIKGPIQQNMMGTAGIFRAQNIEKNKHRPLSVKEWFEKCQDAKFVGPSPKVFERDSKEAAAAREETMRERKAKWAKKKEDRIRRKEEREAKVEEEDVEMEEGDAEVDAEGDGVPPLDAPSSGSSLSSPEPLKTPEAEPLDDWYETTDFNTAWLPKGAQPEDYTVEACARLQEKYWKTMGMGEPSWYGADLMQGSLFADVKTPWNVAHLPNLLDRINCVVPGVNEPYLYFGMWRASFPWHVEDMDLFSINYIHFGAPKFWYAIPQVQADHFERFLANEFPLDARQCEQFIRHKSMAISPTRLKDSQTRVNMLVHNQGEFVITYPRGYHAGFNLGFNCAESVNFATDDWIEFGRKAKHCKCVNYSVRIDVESMLADAEEVVQQEREAEDLKRTREEAGEDETADQRPAKVPRKRIRKPKPLVDLSTSIDGQSGPFDLYGINIYPPIDIPPPPVSKASKQALPKPKKVPVVKEKVYYPCLFCPSLSTTDLCTVFEPNDFAKSQWKGRSEGPITAHLLCAQATPECYFSEEEVDGATKIWVMGANDVIKDRWTALKCKLCTDRAQAASGVKVQCTKGKCPAAFHYSCAEASEKVKNVLWNVEEWLPAQLPADAPPGTEAPLERVSTIKLELLCPTHNPAQKEIKEREKAEEVRQRILQFSPGQSIKMRAGSASMEYCLVAIHDEERVVEVLIKDGMTMKFAYSRVDLRAPTGAKLTENEYARHHVTSRKAEATVQPALGPAPPAPLPYPALGGGPPQRIVHPPPAPTSQAQANILLHQQKAKKPKLQHPSVFDQPIPSRAAPPIAKAKKTQHQHPSVLALPQTSAGPSSGGRIVHPKPQLPPAPAYVHYPPGNHPSAHNPYSHLAAPPANQYAYPHSGYVQPQYPSAQPAYGAFPAQMYPSSHQPQYVQSYQSQHQLQHSGYQHHGPLTPSYAMPAPGYPQTAQPAPAVQYDPRIMAHLYQPPHLAGQAMRSVQPAPRPTSAGPRGMQHLLHPTPANLTTERRASSGAMPQALPQNATSSSATLPLIPTSDNGAARGQGNTVPAPGGVGKIDLGLDRMKRLMAIVAPLRTPAIHIAGTNGKGSVSAMLESAFLSAGLRVARYNSPHLLEPRDAIRLNGTPPPATDYGRIVSRLAQISQQLHINATSFEIATAAAYALISAAKPDIMIIECGMGGARDATNVIPPDWVLATVLTAVGLDHTAFLGETVEAITQEKSDIAVRDAVFAIGRQPKLGARETALAAAGRKGARIVEPLEAAAVQLDSSVEPMPTRYQGFNRPAAPLTRFSLPTASSQFAALDIRLPLPGAHQVDNAALAISILHHLRFDIRAQRILPSLSSLSTEHIQSGVESAKWPGRCSWLDLPSGSGSPILVDGAHNADSAKTLRAYLDTCLPSPGGGRVTFILGLSDSKGKTPESVLTPLLRPGDRVAPVEFKCPVEGMPWIRPVPTPTIRDIAAGLVGSEGVWDGGDGGGGLGKALEWAKKENGKGLVVVCGSLYLVADTYRLLGLEKDIYA